MLEGEAKDNCRGQIMQAWIDWVKDLGRYPKGNC